MGNAQLKSIMLEELASVSMVRSSNVILLILAAISLILGIAVSAGNRAGTVVFAVLFFASPHQVLSLASAGTTITVDT